MQEVGDAHSSGIKLTDKTVIDLYQEDKELLDKIGLNEKEIRDFIDYWSGRFEEYDYYKVYLILNSEIDNYVELNINPKPDSVLRVWLYFEGCKEKEILSDPEFIQFKRNKTAVVEWGGVMLN